MIRCLYLTSMNHVGYLEKKTLDIINQHFVGRELPCVEVGGEHMKE
jgi:hypothetical protein